MPKQSKKIIPETPVLEPTNNDNPDEYILELLSQLGESQAVLQLYRTNDEGKFCYVDDLDPDNFTLKTVKDVYGGGRYKITVLDTGHKFKGRSKDFYIEGPTKPLNDTDFDDFEQDLNIPELSILKREVRELKNLVTSFLTQGQHMAPQRDSEDILLDRMLKYKQLFSQNNGSLTDNLEVLTGVFTKSLEFANRLSGPQEETPFTLLKEFLPTVTDLIGSYMENKRIEQFDKLPPDKKPSKADLKKMIDTGFKAFLSKALGTGNKPADVSKYITSKSSGIEKTRIKEILSKKDPVDFLTKLLGDNTDTTKAYLIELTEALKKDL